MLRLKYHKFIAPSIYFLATIIFTLISFSQSGVAFNIPPEVKKDTASAITVRSFSEKQLDEYKSSSDFQYIKNRPEVLNWRERIKQWILRKILDLIHYSMATSPGKIIVILLVIGLIIYLAYRMAGVDKTGLWAKKAKGLDLRDLTEENIHATDFDKLINEASAQTQYRLAIRLWYLKTLRNLSGKNFISWKPGKTNYEYVAELSLTPYGNPFKELTKDFEYSWYRETTITAREYEILKQQFTSFNQQLK